MNVVRSHSLVAPIVLVGISLVVGCAEKKDKPAPKEKEVAKDAATPAEPLPNIPLATLPARPGYLPPPRRRLVMTDAQAVVFGATLFEDEKRFGGRSCASCHDPERAYTSSAARDPAASGKLNLRNTPSLINLGYADRFYWDGRADSIEALLAGHASGQLGATLDATETRSLLVFLVSRYGPVNAIDRYEAGQADVATPAQIRGARVFC